ncbi:zinc finger protein 600-like [Bradysia coprophila]|uniref:zinc finger protein 600-like n=1 Tax=Bradysia coprophila TaxID=38358 RepID=UPI00187D7447|nr:zinc finger protein 600-like [Bradysia coprophila]
MSSSMMRGTISINSPHSLNMRDNLIIQIDDSSNDSDDNTLHIVEDSVDELIEIDDESESDEQAIDLSMSSRQYSSNKHAEPINFSKIYSAPPKYVEQINNHQLPKVSVLYQPYAGLNGNSNVNRSISSSTPNVSHLQNNGVSWKFENGDSTVTAPTSNFQLSNLQCTDVVQPVISETFVYQCEFCSESFSSDQLLIDHCARIHTKDVKCQHCEKTFYWEKDLHFHMRKHIKKGRGFKCQICTGLFIKNSDLKAHMKIHDEEDASADSSITCDICDKAFKANRLLLEHKKRFLHKQCEVCLEYFSSDATLFQHYQLVHVTQTVASYGCDQCDEVFPKKCLLKLHRDKHRLYVCELCSAEFRRKDDIKSHLRLDCTKKTLFNCSVCSKSFILESNLKSHISSRHYDRNKCEFCSKKFLQNYELEEHLSHHNIEHPYQCQICLAPMTSKRIFNFHLKSHNYRTKFQCEKCCRWFLSGHILQNHLKLHSRDTYNCTICTMSFSDPLRFEQHVRSHDENKFQCDLCKRSFRNRHLIFLHMIDTHQSRKNCHICHKEFINQGRLRTHLKSHYVKVELPDGV